MLKNRMLKNHMLNRRQALWGIGSMAAIVAGGAVLLRPTPTMHPALNLLLDTPLLSVQGAPYPMQSLRHQPLLINVWAPWCAPCVDELPELSSMFLQLQAQQTTHTANTTNTTNTTSTVQTVQTTHTAQQQTNIAQTMPAVQFVGVGVDSAENLAAFAAKTTVSFPLLVGNTAGMDFIKNLGNTSGALPFTVLFDANGRVIAHKTGRIKPAEVLQWLKQLK